MKINQIGIDSLQDYELQIVEDCGVEECWYNYTNYGYDGGGVLVAKIGDKYTISNLSHCSCYGPTDDFTFDGKSLEEVIEDLKTVECGESIIYYLEKVEETGKSFLNILNKIKN